MRRILLFLVFVGLAGAGAYVLMNQTDAGPAAPQNTATVTRGTLDEHVEITGAVTSTSVHNLTFGTAGTVGIVDVALGDRVRRNQLIAKLDATALEAQLAAARTTLTAAESSLKSARSALEATEEVLPTTPPGIPGPLPTTELQHDAALDAARAAVSNAEAAVSSSRAAITAAETALEGTEIRSPVAGHVTRVLVAVGDRVAPGAIAAGLFPVQVMDLGVLRIEAQASETDVVDLAVDQDATITFDALDDITLDGHVCEIESVGILVQGVPTYPVRVCLDNTDARVRVGLTATVNVGTGRAENVLLLPSRAVALIGDKHTVTLLLADNRPVETQVTVGRRSGGMVEIVTGLTEGQRVLLPSG